MSNTWITHKRRRILLTSYTGQNVREMIQTLEEQVEILRSSRDKVLVLDDFTDAYGSSEFMDRAKVLGLEATEKTERNAILGVTGIKKVLLRAYCAYTGARIRVCDSREEALEYLVCGQTADVPGSKRNTISSM